jgi:hypothetical protein
MLPKGSGLANIIKDYCIPLEELNQIFGKYEIFSDMSPQWVRFGEKLSLSVQWMFYG